MPAGRHTPCCHPPEGLPSVPNTTNRGTLPRSTVAALLKRERAKGERVTPVSLAKALAPMQKAAEVHRNLHRLTELGRELRDDDLEPFTRTIHDHYRATMTPVDVYDALAAVQRAGWQLGAQLRDFDLLLTPTLPLPVPELGFLDTTDPAAMWQRGGDYSSFTAVANATRDLAAIGVRDIDPGDPVSLRHGVLPRRALARC